MKSIYRETASPVTAASQPTNGSSRDVLVQQLFESQVVQTPARVAVRFAHQELTYEELNRRANQLAHYLQTKGVGPDTVVGLALDRGLEMAIAVWAVLKADGAYFPLELKNPEERLRFMMEDSGVKVVITEFGLWSRLPQVETEWVFVDAESAEIAGLSAANPVSATSGESLAYLIYTSGSTGRPKGVMVPHRALANYVLWAREFYYAAGEGSLVHSPLGFDLTVTSFFLPLLQGQTIELVEEGDGIAGLAEHLRGTRQWSLLKITPAHANLLAQVLSPHAVNRKPGVMVIGGEALYGEQLEFWQTNAPNTRLINEYGPTEATVGCCIYGIKREEKIRGAVPIGQPIENVRLHLLDHELCPAPKGTRGELYIGGQSLARGYLGRPDLTAERFVPDPFSEPGARMYKTGDIGQRLENGELVYLGREDSQVKVRGYRIELGEIEAVLVESGLVSFAAVVPRQAANEEISLAAYFGRSKASTSSSALTRELRTYIQERLPEYMTPAAFVEIDHLPLTLNGKLDVTALPSPHATRDVPQPAVPPRNAIETTLAAIWSEVLGLSQIGIYDNYFSLGGDSIRSVRVLALAQEQHLAFSLQDIFKFQTIAELAPHVQVTELAAGNAPIATAFSMISEADRARLPEDVVDAYPLTRLQMGMLYHMQMTSDTPAYHNVCSYHLRGYFDENALQEAARRVVSRHPVFRTSFDLTGFSEPMQFVHRHAEMPVNVFDLRHLKEEEQKVEIAAFIDREWKRLFDLSLPPLVRFHIHRLAEEHFQFTFTECHAIVDGWSITSTCAELFKTQLQLLQDPNVPPEPAPASLFRDYVYQERQALASRECEDYWAARLVDAVPLSLPYLKSVDEKVIGPKMQVVAVPITSELAASLRSVATELSVSLKSVFLAVHFKVLAVLSGASDVITGFNIHGRVETSGGEEARGLFLNTLPLRLKLSDNRWSDLIGQAFKMEVESLPYRNYPYAELQRKYGPEALLEVQFNYLHFHSIQSVLKEGMIEVLGNFDISESNFALIVSWQVDPQTYELSLQLYCDRSRFTEEQMRLMGEYYANALHLVAANARAYHNASSLLISAETHQLLEEWNTLQISDDVVCVHHAFEQQADRIPTVTAVVFENTQLSFDQLNRRANQLAHRLRALGIGPEKRVSICLERSLELVVAVLGVLKAGAAYVGLDPLLPLERLTYAFKESESSLLISSQNIIAKMGLEAHSLCINGTGSELEGDPEENLQSGVTLDNIAYIIYTSGSTGKPKAVAGTHRALAYYIQGITPYYKAQGATFALFQNLAVDAPITFLYIALCQGGTLHILSRECIADPVAVSDYLRRHSIDYFKVAPSYLYAALATESAHGVIPRKLLMTGGERTRWDLIDKVHSINPGCRYLNHYGPTETTCGVCTYMPGDAKEPRRPEVPLGRPLKQSQIYILDSAMNLLPIGATGEIYIGGASLARGYLNHADLTAERFLPDSLSGNAGGRLYRSGDLARWLPDGNIEFLGRIDSQVKVSGYRVELGEIEAALVQHQSIKEAAVVLRGQAPETRLIAYVACRMQERINVPELRSYLRGKLPEYMVPEQVVFLESLPRTLQGKIHHAALSEVSLDVVEAEPYVAPGNEEEKILCALFEDVLNQSRVSVTANFFDLGGHSLLATRLATRIRESFLLDLPLRALFESPTVAGLAKRISRERKKTAGQEIPVITRRRSKGPVPLSYAQQRLWFLDQLEPGSAVYNLPFALRLVGDLNYDVLQASVNEIVDRHEALRTRFEEHDGIARQVVDPDLTISVVKTELRELEKTSRAAEVEKLARAEAIKPFDLGRGPILRVTLLELGDRENVLLVTMHHIVGDGWSTGLLVKEFAALYEGISLGRIAQLPELKIQYADFAVWQREWLQEPLFEKEMEYWRRQLADITPLELPLDRPRPATLSHRGAVVPCSLDAAFLNDLKNLGRREGTTLFMTMLAAFNLLMARYSGQNDISVGTPIAGRRWSETEPLIGFFVNTLVLRTQVDEELTLHNFLKLVRETTLTAYEHQDLPFESIVDDLQPERNLNRTPLFQVMLTLQNAGLEDVRLPNIDVTPVAFPVELAKFELNLAMAEGPNGLDGELSYESDLFNPGTISRFVRSFRIFLHAMLAAPHQRINEVSLLDEEEKSQVVEEWNRTEEQFSLTLVHELFERQAVVNPAHLAVIFEGQQLTYGELNGRANQLAHYLKKLGVGPEAPVGICLERSVEMVVGIMGVLKAGGGYLPLEPSYPGERLGYMVREAQPKVVLTQRAYCERLGETGARLICLKEEEGEIAKESLRNPEQQCTEENLVYVIYTSGSTGVPKGVMNVHGGLRNRLNWMQQQYQLRAEDRVLQKTPYTFDVSVWEFLWPLMSGATLVVARPGGHQDSDYLVELMERNQITVTHFVPAMLGVWLGHEGVKRCRSLRRVICSGEALGVDLQKKLQRVLGASLHNLYGPTEASIDVTYWDCPREWEKNYVPIGKGIANTRVYVLNEEMEAAPVGVAGELYLGGVGLARGYVGRGDMTAERFVPDGLSGRAGERLYRTGDLVRWREDGQLEFLGRRDQQVKLRGFRIEMGEIEAVLNQHEGVQESVVVAVGKKTEEKRLVGYVVRVKTEAKEEEEEEIEEVGAGERSSEEVRGVTGRELQRYLEGKLPEYMVPRAYVFLEKLPLTTSGKIDRKALPKPTPDVVIQSLPRDPLELELARIWENVLATTPVGINQNFFDLGGHSLLAIRLVSAIEARMKTRVPLVALFRYPTVEGLASVLRNLGTEMLSNPLVEIQRGGSKRPLFFVHGGGGSAFVFRTLARHLGPEQPLFAFQHPGLESDEFQTNSVPALAQSYIKAMRTVQPEGPYLLGGWSMGGLVAFEMARQLENQDQEVGFLGIVDRPMLSGRSEKRISNEVLFQQFLLNVGLTQEVLAKTGTPDDSLETRLGLAQQLLVGSGLLPPDPDSSRMLRLFNVFHKNIQASLTYAPSTTNLPVHVWYARENPATGGRGVSDGWLRQMLNRFRTPDPTLGWAGIAGRVEVSYTPGNHFTILNEPHVSRLAGEIISCLNRITN